MWLLVMQHDDVALLEPTQRRQLSMQAHLIVSSCRPLPAGASCDRNDSDQRLSERLASRAGNPPEAHDEQVLEALYVVHRPLQAGVLVKGLRVVHANQQRCLAAGLPVTRR